MKISTFSVENKKFPPKFLFLPLIKCVFSLDPNCKKNPGSGFVKNISATLQFLLGMYYFYIGGKNPPDMR